MKKVAVYYADRPDKKRIKDELVNETRIFLDSDSKMVNLMLQNSKEHIGPHNAGLFLLL